MGSSRLPGKVLMDIAGKPALTWMIERLRRANSLNEIVLATTTSPRDNELEAWAKTNGVLCFRGSEDDVLARVVAAHRQQGTEVVVELCGDCPLIDPEIVDLAVETFLFNKCDVVSNARKPSYPQGLDVQIFHFGKLAQVAGTVTDPAVREHVSLYFYEHEDEYRVEHLLAPNRRRFPGVRLQLDYKEDLTFLNKLCARLAPTHGSNFGIDRILEVLHAEPGLVEINGHLKERPPR